MKLANMPKYKQEFSAIWDGTNHNKCSTKIDYPVITTQTCCSEKRIFFKE